VGHGPESVVHCAGGRGRDRLQLLSRPKSPTDGAGADHGAAHGSEQPQYSVSHHRRGRQRGRVREMALYRLEGSGRRTRASLTASDVSSINDCPRCFHNDAQVGVWCLTSSHQQRQESLDAAYACAKMLPRRTSRHADLNNPGPLTSTRAGSRRAREDAGRQTS